MAEPIVFITGVNIFLTGIIVGSLIGAAGFLLIWGWWC